MELYNAEIVDNAKDELIHASLDTNEDSVEDRAAEAHMPWLTVMNKDLKRTDLEKLKTGSLPSYILIDKNGNKVAEGKAASFAKINALATKSE